MSQTVTPPAVAQTAMNTAWAPPTPQGPAPPPAGVAPAVAPLPPPTGASGAPPQAVATAAQGPAPITPKPALDPRPYAWLAENWPQGRALVDHAAAETGVSPDRLAAHWYHESAFQTQVPDGKAGEVGMMQMLPATAQPYNRSGLLDLRQPADNMLLAGRHISDLDSRFGKDSPSSVAAYQGGPGSAADIARNPDAAAANHPRTLAYTGQFFPGSTISPASFVGGGSMNAPDLVAAARQDGPDGFLRYLSQTAPRGMPMGDAMRQAEATLVGFAASRGDMEGMQHARDFIHQLSHAGANQNLMAADQALQAGDGVGAAQYLAKAHAFFPDGTMGRFGVDPKGNVWGERFDENDPSKRLGGPFKVTSQGVQALLGETLDPAKYLATVREQQKTAAEIRRSDAMGDYYGNLSQSRENIAAGRNVAQVEASKERGLDAEALRASRQGTGPAAALAKQADQEAEMKYGADGSMVDKTVPIEQRGIMSALYTDARMQGVSGPEADAMVDGLRRGTLHVAPTSQGTYAVLSGKNQQPVAYISKGLGDRLYGSAAAPTAGPLPGAPNNAPGSSPIGAGAPGAYARGAGVTQNLTGAVMPAPSAQPSSALPPSAQPPPLQ